MVAEARALRERVLTDLNRRRDTLRAYIDQLRADRDRFAEAYRVVRDTVSDANEMLARFGAGRPFPPVTAEAGPPISFPSESNADDEKPAQPVFAPEQRPRIRPPRAARPARGAPSSTASRAGSIRGICLVWCATGRSWYSAITCSRRVSPRSTRISSRGTTSWRPAAWR